ncbi:MAG: ATP-binding protein [Acidobacteriaceae bacterium]
MATATTTIVNSGPVLVPLKIQDSRPSHLHSVQFYGSDSFLIENLGQLIAPAILEGRSALVLATQDHINALVAHLKSSSPGYGHALAEGRLLFLDGDQVLPQFMVNGQPHPARFAEIAGNLLSELAAAAFAPSAKVVVFGEMVASLWAGGRRDAAIQLEKLWNDLASEYRFQLFCAYPINLFSSQRDAESLLKICAQHSSVIPAEHHPAGHSDEEHLHSILLLQQKTKALESEIREREKIQCALEEREAELSDFLENAVVGMHWIAEDGTILWANNAEMALLGYAPDEYIGQPLSSFHVDPQAAMDVLARFRRREELRGYETRLRSKDGSIRDVRIDSSPFFRGGRLAHTRCFIADVTERKLMQEALLISNRLASVGRLAATIAHEINNPLETVTNLIFVSRHQSELSDETRGYLGTADEELGRVAHIVQQTLGFYRDNSESSPRSLSRVIEDVLAIYERKCARKNLRIERRIEPDLSVFAVQGELKQILSNIVTNAIDASHPGGRIAIRARSCRDPRSNQRGIRITIGDSGAGIPRQNREKVFTPFFTTKKEVGTGLGLWIIKDLLEKRGGQVRLRSRDSQPSGTVMHIYLPQENREATK